MGPSVEGPHNSNSNCCCQLFSSLGSGEIVEPKLTTFDVKTKEIGEAAARMLLEQIISKDKFPKTILVKGEFVQLESTRKQKTGVR